MQKQKNTTKKKIDSNASSKLIGEELFLRKKNNKVMVVKKALISLGKKSICKKFYPLDNLLFKYKSYKVLYFKERKILDYKVRLFKINYLKKAKKITKTKTKFLPSKYSNYLKYMFMPSINVQKELSVTNEEIKKGLIEESNQKIKVKKSKKRYLSLAFLLLNIGIIAGILIYNSSTGNLISLTELFASKPYYRYLFLALGLFVVMTLLDVLKTSLILKKSTGYYRPYTSYKVNSIGKYYDYITPLSTGGQPFQVFYLTRSGVSAEKATSVPLARYIFWQFTFVIMAVIILIMQSYSYIGDSVIVITAAWIGLCGNLLIMSVVLTLSLSKKIGPKIIIWILKLGYKIKIVKNYQATFRRVARFVREYQFCMKDFIKSWKTVVSQCALAIISSLLYYTIPYCIYLSFNAPTITVSWIDMVAKILLCDLAVSFIPIPGGAGAAELSFAAVFAAYFPPKTLMWALLIWRLFSYYVYLLQGVLIIIYDYAFGNKKMKRLREQNKWPEKVPKYHKTKIKK